MQPENAAVVETHDRNSRSVWFLLPLCIFFLNLAITWNRWTDPLVDGGRELHTPLRILQGERLYIDVSYYYGPLGPHLNALAYSLFGIHASVLECTGMMAGILGLFALYRIASRLLPPIGASISTGLVAAIPFFLPMLGSVPLPYSYGALYTYVLGWWALERATATSVGREWKAGILLGLSACAKPEAAFQFILAVFVATAFESQKKLQKCVHLLIPTVSILGLVYVPFLFLVPKERLWTEGFLTIFRVPHEWKTYYLQISGFDWLGIRTLELLAVLLAYTGLLLPFFFLTVRTSNIQLRWYKAALPWFCGAGMTLAGLIFVWPPDWLAPTVRNLPPLVRLLPPACTLWTVWILYRVIWKKGGNRKSPVPYVLIFAAALTSMRVLLNARYASGYSSLSLVLPVLLSGIVLIRIWPALIERWIPGTEAGLIKLGMATLFAWQITHLAWNFTYFRIPERWYKVEADRGIFWVTPPERGRLFAEALDEIRKRTQVDETLAAFPEGSMFNFLAERSTPLPQEQLLPGMLDETTERALVQRLADAPPDWVVLTSADYSFFGVGQFGIDFYKHLGSFIQSEYVPFRVFRSGLRQSGGFGVPVIVLYRKK